jgi:hypothetical protein
MRVTPGIEKLRNSGYTVRQVPRYELPLSYQSAELKGEVFIELSINGHKIHNNQDQHGWFLTHELNVFAAKVPDVRQASFAEVVSG